MTAGGGVFFLGQLGGVDIKLVLGAGQVENALRANAEMSSCWRAAFDVSRTSA
jgi:hypothetical protein